METQIWAIGLVFLAGIIGGFGPVYLKKGSMIVNLKKLTTLYKNKFLILGLLVYGLATIIFIVALKGGELSVLYPLVGTTYIWVCLYSIIMLKEKMTLLKWLGVFTIIVGISLISMGV